MRTIVLSIILCGVFLVGWHELVQHRLYGTRTMDVASQFDQNLMKSQSFLYTGFQPDVVIVGSSIAARLTNHPKDWYNLAFAGGSSFTGLEIVQRSNKHPKIVLVETNVLTVARDERLLDSLFFPIVSKARGRFPSLREQYKPTHVLVTELPGGESKPAAHGLSGDRFTEQVERRLGELRVPLQADSTSGIARRLADAVKKLQAKGCRVVFFEVPEYEQSEHLARPEAIRAKLHELFPDNEYAWVPHVDWSNFHTTDAVHLDPDSAKHYTHIVADFVEHLHSKPATTAPVTAD